MDDNNNSNTTVAADYEDSPPPGYNILCVLNLVFSSVACLLCLSLVVATTVPLFNKQRRKRYSTYNLYLAFMAVPDLLSHFLVVYLSITHNSWHPGDWDPTVGSGSNVDRVFMWDHRWDGNIYAMNSVSNLYINVFLTLELYTLLRHSNNRKKHRPPTIARVGTHSAIAYALGIAMFLMDYYLPGLVWDKPLVAILYQVWVLLFVAVVPFGVMGWISYRLVKEKLLRGTKGMYGGRLRILVLCFFRIFATDFLLWIPTTGLFFVFNTTGRHKTPTAVLCYHLGLLLLAFQSIAVFGWSVTKPDARRLLVDLKRGRCYRGSGSLRGRRSTSGGDFRSGDFRSSTFRLGSSHHTSGTNFFVADPYLARSRAQRGDRDGDGDGEADNTTNSDNNDRPFGEKGPSSEFFGIPEENEDSDALEFHSDIELEEGKSRHHSHDDDGFGPTKENGKGGSAKDEDEDDVEETIEFTSGTNNSESHGAIDIAHPSLAIEEETHAASSLGETPPAK